LTTNREERTEKEKLKFADIIYSSGNSLLEFTNKVLDFTKIESGNMEVHRENISIKTICDKIEQVFLPQARKNNLTFTCTIQNENPGSIFTDRLKTEQILTNLLTNAFKFTEEGGVSLQVYTPKKSEIEEWHTNNAQFIAFQVTDTGIGIPKDKQELIFNSFKQASPSTQSRFGGTGLGLAICKELTEMLGGKLTLESNVGTGSSFTLYLPVGRKDYREIKLSPSNAVTRHKSTPTDSNGTYTNTTYTLEGNVLLVDDSKMHNLALKELLDRKVQNCLIATTAEETYKLLEANNINCIILDMILPDANGFEIINHIKARDEFKHVPIIVYTGKNMTRREENILNQYVDSVVYKGVESYKVIMERVTSILHENSTGVPDQRQHQHR
jgi:CheY-like chemotaxis protein